MLICCFFFRKLDNFRITAIDWPGNDLCSYFFAVTPDLNSLHLDKKLQNNIVVLTSDNYSSCCLFVAFGVVFFSG